MTTPNNTSRCICAQMARKYNWKKDNVRNVVTVNGEKWSFSVSDFAPQCRQTYEDTKGFITLCRDNSLKFYRVSNFSKFRISRVSPSGLKAYNVVVKEKEMSPLF